MMCMSDPVIQDLPFKERVVLVYENFCFDDDPGGPWCSTKVYSSGEHAAGYFALCKGSTCDPGNIYRTSSVGY